MTRIRSLLARLITLFRNWRYHAETTEEMSFHLEMEKEANIRAEMSEREANARRVPGSPSRQPTPPPHSARRVATGSERAALRAGT